MLTPLTLFIGSTVLFTVLSVVVRLEEKRQRRYVLGRFRGFLDRVLIKICAEQADVWEHFVHFVLKLGWYYSIHAFLRALMNILVSIYDYLEHKFEKNRSRAKVIRSMKEERRTDSKLSQMAEHKEQVALTPEEGEKLKAEKLEKGD